MKTKGKRHAPHDGVWYFHPPWTTRKAPEAPSDIPWCSRTWTAWHEKQGVKNKTTPDARFGKVRCPRCGRRLQLMYVDIEQGYGDFWPYLPPHKVRRLLVKTPQTVTSAQRRRHKKRERRTVR